MTHRLREQYLEVLPLYGRCVLEFIYHHMLYLRTDLLEDKGRVAFTNQRV